MASSSSPRPLALFLFFARVSTLTIGGGYVMVPVIARGLDKRGWMPEGDFYGLFGAAQSLPGPIGFNAALFSGRALAGVPGLLAAGAGVLAPPFLAILLVADLAGRASGYPMLGAFLDGAYAVVPGLIAALLLRMAKNRTWKLKRVLGALLSGAAMIAFPAWAVPVFFASAALGWLLEGDGA